MTVQYIQSSKLVYKSKALVNKVFFIQQLTFTLRAANIVSLILKFEVTPMWEVNRYKVGKGKATIGLLERSLGDTINSVRVGG